VKSNKLLALKTERKREKEKYSVNLGGERAPKERRGYGILRTSRENHLQGEKPGVSKLKEKSLGIDPSEKISTGERSSCFSMRKFKKKKCRCRICARPPFGTNIVAKEDPGRGKEDTTKQQPLGESSTFLVSRRMGGSEAGSKPNPGLGQGEASGCDRLFY